MGRLQHSLSQKIIYNKKGSAQKFSEWSLLISDLGLRINFLICSIVEDVLICMDIYFDVM